MRVVPDPNVLLSAIIAPGGASDQALRAATTNGRLIVSPHLVQRFLVRASDAKFRRWFTMVDARTLAERLLDAAEIVDEVPREESVPCERHDVSGTHFGPHMSRDGRAA